MERWAPWIVLPILLVRSDDGNEERRGGKKMIYSQLVDMIGHRRKDMSFLSFFFFWKGEKRSADNVGTHVGYRGSNESCRTLI